jgi:hypothetical protein
MGSEFERQWTLPKVAQGQIRTRAAGVCPRVVVRDGSICGASLDG